MLKEYEGLGDKAYKTKHTLAERFYAELAVHEEMEERIFYPAVRENATKEGIADVLEGYEEHHVADLIVSELKATNIEDETYDAKFEVLRENVEHHIDEEEEELFPEARKALGDRAAEIGEKMQAFKERRLPAAV